MAERLCVIANPGSGQNSKGDEALKAAMAVFGDRAELRRWTPDSNIAATVRKALSDGFGTIVAAGGDGTVVSVAQALIGQKAALGVLPLGTFNYFSRGLGLPEDPAAAAEAILNGAPRPVSVGEVNGQVFLNNASLGIYPRILQEREETYRRYGRSRLMAYWSVVRTFVIFQRARRRTITVDGQTRTLRSPLIFAARSAYQLEEFGLKGTEAIDNDELAIFVIRPASRARLFLLAWRLVRRKIVAGRDVDLFIAHKFVVDGRHGTDLVAYDGEKKRMALPITFQVRPEALTVLMPKA